MRFLAVLLTGVFLIAAAKNLTAFATRDSILALISEMGEKEQVAYIHQHFYDLYADDFDLALDLGNLALDHSRKNKWPALEALTLKNLGIVYYLKGDYESPLGYYQRALDLYEQLGDLAGQGQTLKEMGNYFKRIDRHDKAMEQLDRAVRLCEAAQDTNGLTAALDIKGVVLMEQGRLDEAEAIFKQELNLLERVNDEKALSYTLNNLAEVCTGKGLFKQAENYLVRSTEIRERIGDRHGVAININNTGEMLLRSGQPARAYPFFKDAMDEAAELGFTDLHRHTMQMLSETCSALGQHESAVRWLQKSYALKDSLFTVEHSRQVAEMAEKYEAEKKEKELALRQRQLQRRNFLLTLSLAGLVVLGFVSGFIFLRQRLKQRQLKRESELKTELLRSEITLRLQNERLRISRDLHDNLGAELTIIGNSLSKSASKAASEEEKKAMDNIRNNARQAMTQLRETIWAIRSEQFSLRDLREKIGDFAARATALVFQCKLPEKEVFLSPAQTLNLYRIAQEAVTNTVKYAGATHLNLCFDLTPDHGLQMTLSDDGAGFDPSNCPAGNGLSNMKTRAEELGGAFSLHSEPGKGAIISVLIPLQP